MRKNEKLTKSWPKSTGAFVAASACSRSGMKLKAELLRRQLREQLLREFRSVIGAG